jgi:hypothetical protein
MDIPAPERFEPRKVGHNVIDLILSICALLISALSIFMAYYTGDSMDQLVQANSWPALQLESGNASDDGEPEMTFSATNAGIGPAQIYTLQYLVDGQVVAPSGGYLLRHLAQASCPEILTRALAGTGGNAVAALGANMSRPVARTFLSPRETTIALKWQRTEGNAEIWRCLDTARKQGRISLRACYCSTFAECWVAETHTFPPRNVPSCGPQPTVEGKRRPGTMALETVGE